MSLLSIFAEIGKNQANDAEYIAKSFRKKYLWSYYKFVLEVHTANIVLLLRL